MEPFACNPGDRTMQAYLHRTNVQMGEREHFATERLRLLSGLRPADSAAKRSVGRSPLSRPKAAPCASYRPCPRRGRGSRLDGLAVAGPERAVLVLHGQLASALQHRVDLVERALGGLDQGFSGMKIG